MIKRSLSERIFEVFNIIFMLLMIFVTVYPVYYVLICSFSDSAQLTQNLRNFILLPQGFSLSAYKSVFSNPNILTGYRNTLIIAAAGTLLSLMMTSIGAFLLTRKNFKIRNVMAIMILITMYFGGGMIPLYLLVDKVLGLSDTLWALILPSCISTYNLLVMKANFEGIPDSLEESAKIDGANDIIVLFRIVLPLSLPIVAVMVLFYGIGHWNAWFNAMLFIRDRNLYPLQLILREILMSNDMSGITGQAVSAEQYAIGETVKYATIVVATLPILCVYPFVQRYFVSGMMIGAVKG